MGLKAAESENENNFPKAKKRKQHKVEIKESNEKVKSLKETTTNESARKDRNKVMQMPRSSTSNSEPVPDEIQKKVAQKWNRGTVLIIGDSMLTGIYEGRLQIRNSVKLRPFSGAPKEDMRSYVIPLLNKEPSVIIRHVGTNDSTENGIDSGAIV